MELTKEDVSENKSWWSRLKSGLKKTSDKIEDGIKTIFVKRHLDEETLIELEDLLIMSDLGTETASSLCKALAKEKMDKDISLEEVKEFLAQQITEKLIPYAKPLQIQKHLSPHFVMESTRRVNQQNIRSIALGLLKSFIGQSR